MIVVDTSAILTVAFGEPESAACRRELAQHARLLVSAPTFAEMHIVAAGRERLSSLKIFLAALTFEIVPVDGDAASAAVSAYMQWGKGFHRAKLNFGDCFSYALAKERRCPLLFIGNDFAQTDITSALP